MFEARAISPAPLAPVAIEQDYDNLLRFIFHAPVGMLQFDGYGEITTINPAATAALSPILGEIGLTNVAVVFERILPEANRMIARFEAPSGVVCPGALISQRAGDGAMKCLKVAIHKLSPNRLMAVIEDVTDRADGERLRRRQDAHIGAVCSAMRECTVFTVSQMGQIENWTSTGERMRDIADAELTGIPFNTFFRRYYDDIRPGEKILEEARRAGVYHFESWVLGRNDIRLWCASTVTVLYGLDGAPDGYSVVTRDLSDRKSYELSLRRMAETDALTGAPNRRSFMQILESAMREARYCREDLALAMLNIDHFKDINAAYGHEAGDEALRNFVLCANDALRSTDVLGRLGGEEFGLLLRGARRDRAHSLLERIRSMVEDNVMIFNGRAIHFTVSIGLAYLDHRETEAVGDLILRAGDALRLAKSRGRNQISLAA